MLVVPQAGAAQQHASVRNAILEREDLEFVESSQLLSLSTDPETHPERDRVIRSAELRRLARDALSRFDYAAATATLEEAAATLAPEITEPDGRRRLAEIHGDAALVLMAHAESDAAAEEVRAGCNIDASYVPDSNIYPPELVQLYTRILAEQTTAEPIQLTIHTDPSGAEVFVGYRSSTPTPAEISLPPGLHYLLIRRDGFLDQSLTVRMVRDAPSVETLQLQLGPRADQARTAFRDLTQRGPEGSALWRRIGLDLAEATALVLVAPSGEMSAFDRNRELTARGSVHSIDEWLEAAFPPPRAPWFSRASFWVPVAVALAVGVGLTVYLAGRARVVDLNIGSVVRE